MIELQKLSLDERLDLLIRGDDSSDDQGDEENLEDTANEVCDENAESEEEEGLEDDGETIEKSTTAAVNQEMKEQTSEPKAMIFANSKSGSEPILIV